MPLYQFLLPPQCAYYTVTLHSYIESSALETSELQLSFPIYTD